MEVISILSATERANRLATQAKATRPRPPYNILFPSSLVDRAATHLRESGIIPLEQLVLWSGYPTEQGVVLESLLLPETEATWGWVHILPHEQPTIIDWLQSNGQLMFVEAHTHGNGQRATELSDEDRRHPAGRNDGFITLIVPGYAERGIDLDQAGVWECTNLVWRRMPLMDVRSRLRVVSDEEGRDALL